MRLRFADHIYPGDGWAQNIFKMKPPPPFTFNGFGATTVAFGRPTLKLWDRGPDVSDLQEMLNAELGTALEMDGIFGPGTQDAVKHFQAKVYLRADGIVGPDTWAKLNQPASGKELPKSSGGSTMPRPVSDPVVSALALDPTMIGGGLLLAGALGYWFFGRKRRRGKRG